MSDDERVPGSVVWVVFGFRWSEGSHIHGIYASALTARIEAERENASKDRRYDFDVKRWVVK